jgi:hypothetical protein
MFPPIRKPIEIKLPVKVVYERAVQHRILEVLAVFEYDHEGQVAWYAQAVGNPYQSEARGLCVWMGLLWAEWEKLDFTALDPNPTAARIWANGLPNPVFNPTLPSPLESDPAVMVL